jgi:TolB protein
VLFRFAVGLTLMTLTLIVALCGAAIAFGQGLPSQQLSWVSWRAGTFDLIVLDIVRGVSYWIDLDSVTSQRPVWSPDGERLLYVSAVPDGNAEIYVINADGRGRRRLAPDPRGDYWPVWSHSGAMIAFVSYRNQRIENRADLYVLDMTEPEANPRRLTFLGTLRSAPDWSPDDRQIAYLDSNETPGGGLNLVTISTGQRTPVRTAPIRPHRIDSWSPRGLLIFATVSELGTELHSLDLASGDVFTMINGGLSGVLNDWSPDGERLVIISSSSFDMVIYEPASGQFRALTQGSVPAYGSPRWSPDGALIAFVSNLGGDNEIYTLTIDGAHQQQITRGAGSIAFLAWRPCGDRC